MELRRDCVVNDIGAVKYSLQRTTVERLNSHDTTRLSTHSQHTYRTAAVYHSRWWRQFSTHFNSLRQSCPHFFQGFIQDFISEGCKQEVRVSHTDILVLTYLLTYLLECCCVYLVHPKFDLYIFSNKSRQNSLLAVSVEWISVNVNMFAISYLSQSRHNRWYVYSLIAASWLLQA